MKVFKKKDLSKDKEKSRASSVDSSQKLPKELDARIEFLKPYHEKNMDIIIRYFNINSLDVKAAVIYLNGVSDQQMLHQHILRPLILDNNEVADNAHVITPVDYIAENLLSIAKIQKTDEVLPLISSVFSGLLVLMIDGYSEALIIDIHGGSSRSIDEPPAERTVRGPRDGFIEILDVNIPLIRRRLKDPHLVVEQTTVGKVTQTNVAIIYIDNIADQSLVEEIRRRINKIKIDGIVGIGPIEQLIEDNPYSPFPQAHPTERPDKVVADLLEGKVALLVDGTPVAIILPALFVSFFQAPEDYNDRAISSSLIRSLRFIAFFLAISLPSLYIALLSFHHELIPFQLIVPLAQARKAVPFSVVTEVILMGIIIQLIIEAGLRLPGPVGQTVGVVSGIILGQAAIAANLASPGVIIVIAVTAIATFSLPAPSMVLSIRILHFPMVILASTLGLFGTSLGWFFILFHLIGLQSVGVPYLSPLSPTRYADLKDTLVRTFTWRMTNRPVSIPGKNKKRLDTSGGESEDE